MKKTLSILGVGAAFLPMVASAQGLGGIEALAVSIGRVVGILIPIVFGIAVLVFFWGVAKYILSAGEEESKAEGRRLMIGGLIALFVIASVWGLVRWIQAQLNITNNANVTVPSIVPGANPFGGAGGGT